MRKPIDVLNSLKYHADDSSYKYKRLYRNFYNPGFYYQAYLNIQSGQGNMTCGVDSQTIYGVSQNRIESIISKMKDCSYRPTPARRVCIPKAKGKHRPLGIPSFNDKLIQEVCRMLLESIYEPTFSNLSHGFRPNRSCHTAMLSIRQQFKETKWFIEGDIVSFFNNIDHHVLTDILRERIRDEQFIALVWKFLKAGYMEFQSFQKTYSGTPRGSIISPILSNIYLDKLDKYMEEYISSFNERKMTISKVHELDNALNKVPSIMAMDDNFKRLSYMRYADNFLCGVIGKKEDAVAIKTDIANFLNSKLHLELSNDNRLITHGKDKVKFLGFEIFVNESYGRTARKFNGLIKIYVPNVKWVKRLQEYGALKIKYVDGKEIFEPIHRNYMVNNDDLEILNQFNREICGMYNYYRIADNVSVLNNFYYVMSYSMYKTYAAKYKTHISSIRRKYGVKKFAIPYINEAGKECKAYFYDKGFRVNRKVKEPRKVDLMLELL
ncbi:MAG: group II intron reverse transcriptase/maturase [Clostridia bacterium]|nr:group II intron reverse transcriptase/maturase [Clostridia bacterium]